MADGGWSDSDGDEVEVDAASMRWRLSTINFAPLMEQCDGSAHAAPPLSVQETPSATVERELALQTSATGLFPEARQHRTFALLHYFARHGCVRAADERDLKKLWGRTLAIRAARPAPNDALLPRVLKTHMNKMRIWNYLSVPHEVRLPATLQSARIPYAVSLRHPRHPQPLRNMLKHDRDWPTESMPPRHAVTFIVTVLPGSNVTGFEIVTLYGRRDRHVEIRESFNCPAHTVATPAATATAATAAATIESLAKEVPEFQERTLVPLAAYGIIQNPWQQIAAACNIIPSVLEVETKATAFRVTVSHSNPGNTCAGLSLFRILGTLPPRC